MCSRRRVAKTAQVDPGEHDLVVALRDAAADLVQDGVGRATARTAANKRDHAEGAAEGAAVLDLHEGAHAVQPYVSVDAADRPEIAGDEVGRLLARARHDHDVLGSPAKGRRRDSRAAGDVHTPGVRAARATA